MIHSLRQLGVSSAALVALVAPWGLLATPTSGAPIGGNPNRAEYGAFGFDAAGLDGQVAPGDDFDKYANGSWEARTQIPDDKVSWGSFNMLSKLSEQRMRDIIENAGKAADSSPNATKISTLYHNFMDEAGIEARGTAPLQPDLATIAAIATPAQLSAIFGADSRDGLATPIETSVSLDLKDPDSYVVEIDQGGLGLPRDYYLVMDNPKFAAARKAYRDHIAKMLTLAGLGDAGTKAQAIINLETRIAQVHWSTSDSRQVDKLDNPVATRDLAARFPGIDWPALLGSVHLDGQSQVIVSQPSAIEGIAKLVSSAPVATWQAYLCYHLIQARADVLPKAFVDERFAFSKTVNGLPSQPDRWKRGVGLIDNSLGDAVGELYVRRYFSPQAKASAEALVRDLIDATKARLERVTWMVPETKAKALQKLANLTVRVGYPDKWRDYSALEVKSDDIYGNLAAVNRYNFDYLRAKLGHTADRREWSLTPQTVNASSDQQWTQLTFPAAILQPPFFDPNADPAVNYGGIGAVIGHEISHQFDDQGSKFDAQGRLAEWWTPLDRTRFKAFTDRVVAQYGAYEAMPGAHVNGELTLGENMADLAGINIAYDAWMLSLKGKPAGEIDGYTGPQRFFLGFAQIWRQKMRDETSQMLLTIDPHSPTSLRANVVRNMNSWYAAFSVKPGQKLFLLPDRRINVW
jgi:putative endopeptidase